MDQSMELIEWKDEYSVGVPLLDDQHKQLVSLINQLTKAQSSGGMINYVLDELDHYVKEHFRAEEKLLKKAGYADFKAHKDQHRAFEDWLRAVRQSFGIGGSSSHLLADSINAYLRNWLINHILKSDMAYKPTLNKQ
ncbi:bacteriohemerythrin [Motiliproteus sp. MSK22-1]|uniref:bacteriohemerythrin n=1 Tax=Motiliproteus sp. MSK22-1 TaxID=1897630 RepID=UPI000976F2FC|nr:bacteriohemerythrin [Motiliproteus sp. MSK22-1]OMH33587.1 hypothetical protein BGP75_11195 [Motiliproteus sp. MSK22-1]